MSQFAFGAGVLWGTPITDSTGASIVTPNPVQFGTVQEISIDVSFEVKELYGQNQFAVAVGRGKGKITGKAKAAQMNGGLINSLFYGQTLTTGIIADVYDTTGAVIPATPFSITPTVPSSGTWAVDLGVSDSNGVPLTKVAAAGTPTTGQYKVAAGVYTFAAADTGKTVFIDYQYTATSTTAPKSNVQNVLMGYAPTFRIDLSMPYNGKSLIMTLPNCVSTKLAFATKLDDFMIPEFDFNAFADGSGNVLTYALSDM